MLVAKYYRGGYLYFFSTSKLYISRERKLPMYSLGTDQIINDSMKEVKWWQEVVMCQVCPAHFKIVMVMLQVVY